TWRWQPELRTINGYHAAPGYINALAASIEEHWQQQGRGEHLLFSFHGLPQRNLELGDPYFCFCHKTARLTATKLKLADDAWSVAFQSRLGRAQWLQPYTDVRVRELAAGGIETLDVISPAFAADCLETLEELAIRNAGYFQAAGGETLRYIPALNAREDHIRFLADLIMHHCQGWPETSSLWNKTQLAVDLTAAQQKARGLGAKR
ncbi:MAG TPA: ferrochelatase, partial [Gammaproteobacteria bacterium]|nr:ferrochelatase [Gammaproteobacteria bacterium]